MGHSMVKDVMSAWMHWVPPEMLLDDAITRLRILRVSHLFVGTPDKLMGVLSEREVQRAVGPALAADNQAEYEQLVNGFTVEEIMERDGVCVELDATATEAVQLMRDNNTYVVPVLDGCVVVGQVTQREVVPVGDDAPKMPYAPALAA
ncbi:MAG: CBS domain-containing protein [Myxococcaceae bacterium]|nr:CBS domain-containing protein [Myxococcaceae bacterium]